MFVWIWGQEEGKTRCKSQSKIIFDGVSGRRNEPTVSSFLFQTNGMKGEDPVATAGRVRWFRLPNAREIQCPIINWKTTAAINSRRRK